MRNVTLESAVDMPSDCLAASKACERDNQGVLGLSCEGWLALHTCGRHALPLHLLEHGDLLLQKMVEEHYLVLQLETRVVCFEEIRILLLQLLPYQLREAWLHFCLLLQGVDHLQKPHPSQHGHSDVQGLRGAMMCCGAA